MLSGMVQLWELTGTQWWVFGFLANRDPSRAFSIMFVSSSPKSHKRKGAWCTKTWCIKLHQNRSYCNRWIAVQSGDVQGKNFSSTREDVELYVANTVQGQKKFTPIQLVVTMNKHDGWCAGDWILGGFGSLWVSSLLSTVWWNGQKQPSVFSLFHIAKSERVQNINVLCCGDCNLLWSALRETQHFTIFFSLQSGAMCVCQLGLALQHKMGCEIDLCKLWSYPLPLQLASYFSILTKTKTVGLFFSRPGPSSQKCLEVQITSHLSAGKIFE
jgi:hypothetical protein